MAIQILKNKQNYKIFKNKIILINIKKNSGVSVALNLGIKISKGKYVNQVMMTISTKKN